MKKEAKSWGHKVEPLADDQARLYDPAANGGQGGRGRRWPCAKCKAKPAAFSTTFYYVTGKAGRVTDRWSAVCGECAAKFAAKNGVPMPTAPEVAVCVRCGKPSDHPYPGSWNGTNGVFCGSCAGDIVADLDAEDAAAHEGTTDQF